VEVLRIAYVEEMVLGAPVWETMVEAPALMGAVGASMSPRANGGHMNGAEPQPEDAPGRAALTPRTLNGPSFNPFQEAALDDVMSVPRPFDIVDLGTGELRLQGYPRAPLLPASWGQVAGGVELTCSRVTTVR
jgi:hypothetical protein